MSFKEKTVVAVTVAGLVTGALWYTQPRTQQEVQEQRIQEQRDQLADSQDRQNQRNREQGMDDAEANRRERLGTGEHRPPEPPRLRFRR